MSARVTSKFWVSAFIARHMAQTRFATPLQKGADGAGAIYIIVDHLDGTNTLFGPAPQSFFDEDNSDDGRIFELLLSQVDAATCRERLDKEQRFDPDIWIVALEDSAIGDQARHGLNLVAPPVEED